MNVEFLVSTLTEMKTWMRILGLKSETNTQLA